LEIVALLVSPLEPYSGGEGALKMLRMVGGAIAALVLAGGGYWAWQTSIAADVGAAAVAKVFCSCVFVEGRSVEACQADQPPGFDKIPVTVDATMRTATGSVFGIIARRARYSEQYGCTLEP
jgi:hypothetical protein